jgi:hypothetical protein
MLGLAFEELSKVEDNDDEWTNGSGEDKKHNDGDSPTAAMRREKVGVKCHFKICVGGRGRTTFSFAPRSLVAFKQIFRWRKYARAHDRSTYSNPD